MLKLGFEWRRIHIKNGVGSALFVSGVLSNSALVYICEVYSGYPRPRRPGPPKFAQANPNLQVLPGSPKFSQVLPGTPRSSQEISDFLRFCGFPGFPGRTWVLFSAFFWVSGISWENLVVIFCVFVGFRHFLGEPGCYFLRFSGFSGISWENLGVIFCVFLGFRDFLGQPGWKQLGMGLGELQELVDAAVELDGKMPSSL